MSLLMGCAQGFGQIDTTDKMLKNGICSSNAQDYDSVQERKARQSIKCNGCKRQYMDSINALWHE